jgi:hypothetical protein
LINQSWVQREGFVRSKEEAKWSATRPSCAILLAVVGIVALLSSTIVRAQTPVTLQEQLNSQYKLVKMGKDSGGEAVVDPGTLLVVQKGGVLSVPWKALALCPAKFQDNSLHPSTGMCAAMVKSVSRYFQTGNKVYPLKIEVNTDKEKISFTVVSCDSCNGINPPTSYKGEVTFQFAKGYLEKANAAEVEDTIGQVFSISSGDDAQQGQGQEASGNAPQAQQPAASQEQPQPDPQTIQLGQTTDQVQAALGKPEKIVNLGAKQIYVYKDLKITFMNGKVSDVQ